MELWIPITIAAAFFQNLRSALQKHLKGVIGTTGATFVRFGYGLPIAAIYWLFLVKGMDYPLPELSPDFWLWVIIAALAQIAATVLLLYLFSFRNFVVGTAYSRTEAMQAAIMASIMFGAVFTIGDIAAIIISVIGLMVISVARSKLSLISLVTSLTSKTAIIGIISGTAFGLAAVGYRQAAISVVSDHFIIQACTTLLIGIAFQTVVMLIWMAVKESEEIKRVIAAWKPALIVGFAGATASFGWFTAFTLQEAAVVKVLAQVEILFTFMSGYFIFKERMNAMELLGCALIVAGIFVLVAYS